MTVTGILTRKVLRSAVLILLVVGLSAVLAGRVPGGFVPDEDNGYMLVSVQLPDAASIERTDAACRKIESILAGSDAIASYTTVVGFNILAGSASSNAALYFVALKPWDEREVPAQRSFEVIQALNARLMLQVPEAIAYAFGPPAIPGLGTGSGFSFVLQDRSGNSPQDLAAQVASFLEAARRRPEIGAINSVYRANVPQLYADVDTDRVLQSGVALEEVNTTLAALLGSAYVNDFNRFGRVYKVFLTAEPEYRDDPQDLASFFVRGAGGRMVPVSTLVSMEPTAGPESTNRFNLYRSAVLSGVPAPGFTSAETLDALEEVARETLPPGWGFDWTDMSYQEKKAGGTAATVFVLAIVLVFLILAAQYESWSLPFSVLLGTPFAFFGAFLGLFLARLSSPVFENNVFAQIGLVMLIGLAAKNAILIVEFARARQAQGLPVVEAALEAAKLRLRPILMTAFAFILGVVPLLTASGAGASARKVMGMTVFAGMLIATILGVLLVPALFVMVERLTAALRRTPAPSPSPPSNLPGPGPEPSTAGGH